MSIKSKIMANYFRFTLTNLSLKQILKLASVDLYKRYFHKSKITHTHHEKIAQLLPSLMKFSLNSRNMKETSYHKLCIFFSF